MFDLRQQKAKDISQDLCIFVYNIQKDFIFKFLHCLMYSFSLACKPSAQPLATSQLTLLKLISWQALGEQLGTNSLWELRVGSRAPASPGYKVVTRSINNG